MTGISRKNPFPRQNCDRHNCPLQTTGQSCKETCFKEGIVYQAICVRCREDQEGSSQKVVDSVYIVKYNSGLNNIIQYCEVIYSNSIW